MTRRVSIPVRVCVYYIHIRAVDKAGGERARATRMNNSASALRLFIAPRLLIPRDAAAAFIIIAYADSFYTPLPSFFSKSYRRAKRMPGDSKLTLSCEKRPAVATLRGAAIRG